MLLTISTKIPEALMCISWISLLALSVFCDATIRTSPLTVYVTSYTLEEVKVLNTLLVAGNSQLFYRNKDNKWML